MANHTNIALILSFASFGLAATPIPGIYGAAVTGNLDGCTVDTTEFNSGGTVLVDGWSFKVPKNLIVQFPVVWVPFGKLCAAGVTNYEVTVNGNVVSGQAIAAQIIVAQGISTRAGQGYIASINGVDASFKILGGPTVKLSDPNGVFGAASSDAPFFPVDDENPSITAFSGFPMCIPRSANDPKCPSSNRPAGSTNFPAPDPLAMVPLAVGDFIEYTGIKSGNTILAFEVAAINVQVTTTASNTVPQYIRVEDALIGVFDTNANIEAADLRFIGYLSSCANAAVTVFAIDVDPCTGAETERQIGSATPRAGDVRCKWEARIESTIAQTPYTREYVIRTQSKVITTKDGIEAGKYVTPVTEWIYPEVNVPGAEFPAFNFNNFRNLVQGDFLDGKQYEPLSPFPGPNPPAPSKTCSPGDATPTGGPVAFIAPFTAAQRGGAQILLVAQNNNTGIPDSDVNYSWTKISPASPSVSITSSSAATATVNLPKVTAATNFVFEVTLQRKSNTTQTSKARVTVAVNPTALDVVTVNTYTWESRQSGTIGVTCSSNVVNGDNKKMSLLLNNGATTLTMTSTEAGKWSYSSNKVKQPTNVQCVSDLGGKSELVTAPRRRKRGFIGRVAEKLW
ncbi:hypothetical protein P280DRAFT_485872 [Massarina eburnea CBS 473.64]|uniref:Uncharacterized protein n=1 Tax=Massarina eburnea CBS 473.64 TaxID=1395130 RepID=A0A6A6SHB8_9PLEO|nr:hypothetical protein P280DRAFT_485872 [Massarina eburnea CBS 473.64]